MLQKASRLTLKKDFENIRLKGKFINTNFFTVSYLENDSENSRFGFIVSKKVSMKATQRNKIRRKLREIIKANMEKIKKRIDFVIVARASIIRANFDTIETQLIDILKNV